MFAGLKRISLALVFGAAACWGTAADAQNWTGFYVGGHGGYSWGVANPEAVGTPNVYGRGGLGGLQGGYDFQVWGPVVIGAAADISFGNVAGTVEDGPNLSYRGHTDLFGSVRGRLGVTFADERILVYGTGGLAWARNEASMRCPDGVRFGVCAFTGGFTASDSKYVLGWSVGGGAEMRLWHHLAVGVEYRYTDFGSHDYSIPVPKVGPVSGRIAQQTSMVLFDVNWRF
jgi:outer membrane immunogenic protein